jgi:polyketide synthase PksN
MMTQELLQDLTESYLKSLFAEISGLLTSDFDSFASYGELGINSFHILKIISRLEGDFGTLPKSLLFENFNVHDLTDYFVDTYKDTLTAKFAEGATADNSVAHAGHRQSPPVELREEAKPSATSRSDAPGAGAAAVRILAAEVYRHPELERLVQTLFDSYKTAVSRGTRRIAPNLFIGSARRGYFNYGRSRNIILLYGYTGPRDYQPVLLEEVYRYCAAKEFQLNIVADEEILSIGGTSCSATPFGALQDIVNLQQFTLEGGAMRHLRYQVSRFSKSGICNTQEYKCGTNPEIDNNIATIIDRWCESKTMVNPLIHDVRKEILAGALGPDHRLFLTYLDGVLQNVILITAMSSEINGYLMDLEFYPPDMPMGGLEFAIVEIIKVLVAERCDVLSLGGTFGCKLNSSAHADPEIDRILDDLRKQNIFDDKGNLQFKNKFRPETRPIFLCRPVGSSNPGNVIDIITMIADPEKSQTSDEENHSFGKAQCEVATCVPEPAAPAPCAELSSLSLDALIIAGNDRSRILSDFGFDPLNIPFEHVEFDLQTDSWAQLRMPSIEAQMRQLHAQLQQPVSIDDCLRAVFPFAHFVVTNSGEAAEHLLFKVWPKKGVVLQNLLFPSTLFHEIDNGMTGKELPHPAVFDLNSQEIYKSNMDWEGLQALVAQDPSGIAFVCIEVSNNAAGGYPASMQHLRNVKTLLAEHSIPLVIDGTRVVENAQFLIEKEKECADKNIWSVVRQMLSYADVVIGSLTKDFCVNQGGIIATNDVKLYHRLQELDLKAGKGIDLIGKRLIALSLQNQKHIEAKVVGRMESVRMIWRALDEHHVPVVRPVGGHCVLIDVKQIPEFKDFRDPAASFVAWMYLNTGIRAGAHSVGMQRHTRINDLVRLAVPVGLRREQVDSLIDRFTHAFSKMQNIPEVVMKGAEPNPLGTLSRAYELVKYHNIAGSIVEGTDSPSVTSVSNLSTVSSSAPGSSTTTPKLTQSSSSGEWMIGPDASKETQSSEHAVNWRAPQKQEIAIVGIAGRYPKARNLGELWENLAQGRDCIDDIPTDRYERRLQHGSTERYRGGFIDDVDKFDSLFFNISPREAEIMDPQERLFLEVAWEAIEDAGYYPESLARVDASAKIGVFVGAVWAMYQILGVEGKHAGAKITPHSFLWSIANRVSYWMNLSGPSLTVDTACSSSLTAVYLACEAIHAGECSAAIVGGVNLDVHQAKLDINRAGGALSEDGVSRSFGKGANGYVAGEGIGALFLKPLDQAVRDGDNIYGVIKSAVVNHGGRTAGYTVPNPKAQTNLILAGLKKANLDARSIGYIEAHGTGTELGDPIEAAGMTSAFSTYHVEKQTCGIGSIKSNIGHLEAAAGVVSISKVLLQMKHRQLVPSLHSTELNEFIDFENSPFYVVQNLEEWKARDVDGLRVPLRAGVSSFGAGGANAHIILEAYKPIDQASDEPTPTGSLIFPLSAKNEDRLRETAVRLAKCLRDNDVRLNDVAYTLQVGRKSFDHRLAIIAKTREELLEKLAHFIAGKADADILTNDIKTAQGIVRLLSQREKEEFVQVLLQGGDPHKVAGLWIEGLLGDWQGAQLHGPGKRVSLPTYPFADERHWALARSPIREFLQPAAGLHPLVDTNESTFERQLFKKTFHERDFFIHDHHVANIPTLPGVAYLELARKAGEIAAGRRVQKIRNVVWLSPIAVRNSTPLEVFIELKPGETTVRFEIFSHDERGDRVLHSQGALLYASGQEAAAEAEYIDLESIRARCAKAIDGQTAYPLFKSFGLTLGPSFQVLQEVYKNENETLGVLKLPEFRKGDLQSMVLHPSLLDGSLQAGMSAHLGQGVGEMVGEMFVPFSIGEVEILHPLQSRCFSYVTQVQDDKKGKKEKARIVKSNVLIVDQAGKVLVKIRESAGVPLRDIYKKPVQDAVVNDFSTLYYSYEWEKASLAAERVEQVHQPSMVLFDTAEALRDVYQERLRKASANSDRVILVRPGETFQDLGNQCYQINPRNQEDFSTLFEHLVEKQCPLENICFAWPLDHIDRRDGACLKDSLEKGVYSFLFVCQGLIKQRLESKARLLFVYSGKPGETQAENEAVGAFIKVLRLEHPKLLCKAIEVRQESFGYEPILDAVLTEFQTWSQDATAVRYEGRERSIKNVKALDLKKTAGTPPSQDMPIREKGVYLITGGAGGLGLIFAEFLTKEWKARVVLSGRSKLSVEREARLEQMRKQGAEVLYLTADVSNSEDVESLIHQSKSRFGEIHGIIHAAGVLRDSLIRNKTREEMSAVLAPKVWGTLNLDEATKNEPLDFFVMFSSLSAVSGNIGQCDYSFANHFMDSFVNERELLRAKGTRCGKTLSFNWSIWADGGMKLGEQTELFFRNTLGLKPLGTQTGVEALLRGLTSDRSQIAVLEGIREKVEVMWGPRTQEPTAAAMAASASSVSSNQSVPVPPPIIEHAAIPTNSQSTNASPQPTEFTKSLRSVNIHQLITTKLSDVLHLEVSKIRNDLPFADYGVTSIMGVNLMRALSEILRIELDPIKLFEYTTVGELADYICTTWPEQVMEEVAQPPANAGRRDDAITEIPPGSEANSKYRFTRKAQLAGANSATEILPDRIQRDALHEPIAIIGMSGRFAEAESLDEFWQSLKEGKNLVKEVSRWSARDCVVSESAEHRYCSCGGFVESIDRFDPSFFGISTLEAIWMDPQQRLFLEESWRALEDAGYGGKSVHEKECGVYVGCSSSGYDSLFAEDPPPHVFSGNAVSAIPARIAYCLNLQGPAIAVDTASSSSLTAVHLACQGLWCGEIEMALAGGVFLEATPTFFNVTNGAGLLSPDGKCYSFDARANGFVPGEGVGVVVLRRLRDALRDGDHIHGVIAGSGVNQNGKSNGLMAPNLRAQERLERLVYDRFKINPETIQFVEANGTGTMLGDSVEYQALHRAFQRYTERRQFCALGAVATNIGHAAAAAGVAGLLKVVLSLKHRQIPPSLHFQTANPAIDFESGPFYFNTQLKEWRVDDNHVRRAAVSSFGIAGTNAHLVIEEAPSRAPATVQAPGYVVVLSGRTAEQLKQQVRSLLALVKRTPDLSMNDLSFSLFVGRMHLTHRLSCLARTQKELVHLLEQWLETGMASNVCTSQIQGGKTAEHVSLTRFGNQCIQECRNIPGEASYLDHLATIADLYIQGYSLDFQALFSRDSKRIPLPTYPFADERYWIGSNGNPSRSIGQGIPDTSIEVEPVRF